MAHLNSGLVSERGHGMRARHAHEVAPFDRRDVAAIKALARGEASKEQQERALMWIVECVARTYADPFVPGDARATDYALGCASVGRQIVTLINARLNEPVNEEQGR